MQEMEEGKQERGRGWEDREEGTGKVQKAEEWRKSGMHEMGDEKK